jgi:hypothetical protein
VQQGPRAAAGGRTKRCCSETIWRARVLTHSLKRSNYDICRHHAQNHSASVGVSNSRCYILRESVLLLLLRAVSVEAADKRRGNSVTELDVRITASEATGVDLQLFSGNLQSSGVDVLRRPGSSSSSSSSIESCSLQRLSVRNIRSVSKLISSLSNLLTQLSLSRQDYATKSRKT